VTIVTEAKPLGHGSAVLHFTFEAAHRQPKVGGKCFNLHGHSWNLDVQLYNSHHIGGIDPETGLSIEFSLAKSIIRNWLDFHFDHATLLGVEDMLVDPLLRAGCKVFLFGLPSVDQASYVGHYEPIAWPSVEAVAFCIGERIGAQIGEQLPYAVIEEIKISETCTNSFTWTAPATYRVRSMVISEGQGSELVAEECG
jgi:6-pyruvoyltetrahydropterin/6-carboxytetrahydropterin synthase